MHYEILYNLYTGVHYFLSIIRVALYVYALMTWFARPDSRIYITLSRLCDPFVAPFRPLGRKLIQSGLRVDLSVWFAAIALRILDTIIFRVLFAI